MTGPENTTRPAGITSTVMIAGMTCEHCVSSVTEELSALDGVNSVTVSLVPDGLSTAEITADRPLTDLEVREAITEAGYLVSTEPS